MNNMKIRSCMDLFCGAGGMSLGLERAGFSISGAFEKDETAGKTYAGHFTANHAQVVTGFGETDGDIAALNFGEVAERLEKVGVRRLDLLSGGPPCQGFSRAGRGKIASLDDDKRAFAHDVRNTLVHDFCRAVETLRPRAFLIENVTGMLSLGGENHAEHVCARMEQAGYHIRLTVLNAAWYGTPQNRERLFIMGLAPNEMLPTSCWFPTPTHKGRGWVNSVGRHALEQAVFSKPEWIERHWPDSNCLESVTVSEALDDLPTFTKHLDSGKYKTSRDAHDPVAYRKNYIPSDYAKLMRNWDARCVSDQVLDHFCRYTPRDFGTFLRMEHGARYPRAVELAAQIYNEAVEAWDPESGESQPLPSEYIPPYPLGSFDERWRKLHPDRPSWTVTAHLSRDCYSHIHHDSDQSRTISMREAARLQGFPDAFVFEGSMGTCFKQIGNAVPPLLANAIGMELMKHLDQKPQVPTFAWESHQPTHNSTWSVIHKAN